MPSPRERLLGILEFFRLIGGDQGIDDLLNIPIHKLFQLIDGQTDAMVGKAALGKIICSYSSMLSMNEP